MSFYNILQTEVSKAMKALYDADIDTDKLVINITKKEFEGDYTVVTFPFSKVARKKPELIAEELGTFLVENTQEIEKFNVIKGFLNLTFSDLTWKTFLFGKLGNSSYGTFPSTGKKVLVEFSSPNTNKPLHLGHIRNILLGWSTSKILEAAGNEVVKAQIINDRGIAICKSMLAWKKYANGMTPEKAEIKSDRFVGDWYVYFEKYFQKEYADWQQTESAQNILQDKKGKEEEKEKFFKRYKNEYFNQYSDLGKEAKEMLLKWESGDPETKALWQQMNGWVYEGFDVTYENLGVSFDKLYYESDTYLLGKDIIEQGLQNDVFYKKEDGSIWIDLEKEIGDHKLVLRSDGTSVYITQDIGTAQLRYKNHGTERMIYVVADEQNYHFKALFETLKKLGEPYAEGCHHLSYGMVNLPEGRMKSREGTVVDADDLMVTVIEEAKNASKEIGTIADLPEAEQTDIIRQIGMAALKFFIIKVNPTKSMIFNPKESVELTGQTGPYIQYSAVRTKAVQRKVGDKFAGADAGTYTGIYPEEKEILILLHEYPNIIKEAAENLDPSQIANYCYSLAKAYNKFWNSDSNLSIIRAESPEAGAFRLNMTEVTGHVLVHGMGLLGIDIPERM